MLDSNGFAPPPLRVATWNVHRLKRGIDVAASLLRSLDLDLIAIQEIDRLTARSNFVDQPAELARRVGLLHHRFFPAVDRRPGDYGLALLSRWPLSGERVGLLPNQGGAEPRIHASVVVASPFGDLDVHVTHLCSWQSGQELRVAQARRIATRLQAPGPPRLLLGDFNDSADSPVLRVISGVLADAFAAAGSGDGATFNLWPLAGRRIDYVFASAELSPLGARVIRTSASDHHLVRADFGFVPALSPWA